MQEISRSNICSDERVDRIAEVLQDVLWMVNSVEDRAKLLLKAALIIGLNPEDLTQAVKWWNNDEIR